MKKPMKNKNGKPVLLAERSLTGTAPKRRVFTRAEQEARAREKKTKPDSKAQDERNVSRRSRYGG